ncbi:MAG: TatD family hydrolase [Oscillospiraceae bacterium]|nr:TatD family hydrolase [Oscillospiraceae bacterium]
MNYTNIFDTHAHYADAKFDQDRDLLLSKTLPEAGIKYIMLAGVEIPDCFASAELAEQYAYLYCSAGLHPGYLHSRPDDWQIQIRTLAKFPKCKAIGEIGLDYHNGRENADLQKKILIQQILLAKELDLPCIFHFRDATGDAVEILKSYQPRGILHCFNSSAETAKELLKIPDLYFSFSGVITYKNARKPVEAIQIIPAHRLLIETDSPYLAPEPFRHQRCDSSMIQHTAEKAAALKNIPVQDFITICCENARRIFHI